MNAEQREWVRTRWDKILDAEQFSQGPMVEEFEQLFAAWTKRKHAVAVSNGTVALELALRAMSETVGLRTKRVAAPALTVPMVHWAIEKAGLECVKFDSDRTFLIDHRAVTQAAETLGAVLFVWTAGIMTREGAEAIKTLRGWGIPVLEDASHAHGCMLDGKIAGSFGDVAVFSMYGTKVLPTGEGGVVVTDNDAIADWVRRYANAGKKRNDLFIGMQPAWNCRMTEMQAALGSSYVTFAKQVIGERQKLAAVYREHGLVSVQDAMPGLESSYYKFTVMTPDADRVIADMKKVGARTTQKTHGLDDTAGKPFGFPVADLLAASHVNPPTGFCTIEAAHKSAEALLKYTSVQLIAPAK